MAESARRRGGSQPDDRRSGDQLFDRELDHLPEISRDLIGHLRGTGLIASGPRSPTAGAPYTYATTKAHPIDL